MPTHLSAAVLLAAIATAVAGCGTERTEAPGPDGAAQRQALTGPPVRPLRYDIEYPPIGYASEPLTGRVARLGEQLASGAVTLQRDPRFGLLPSLLDALDIDPASQTLVFSRTSFQVSRIGPETPRAIYFNDDTYVAALHGSDMIEIASMDPVLGPVFHTLGFESPAEADYASESTGVGARLLARFRSRDDTSSVTQPPQFEREMERCLRCHDSLTMSGGGVPRFMLGSGYIGRRGELVSHEGWILTTQRTPIRSRWGGWYVTGRHGEQVHLGNLVVRDVATLSDLESLRVGNLDALPPHVDGDAYLTDTSDIVALMVLQHQTDVQNAMTRVAWDVRTALEAGEALDRRIAEMTEPLVHALLFVGEARLTDRISGSNDFGSRFEARGPHDSQGRTLRTLDLETRLLRYPLSWLIHSDAFAALPEPAKAQVLSRIGEVLRGDETDEAFAHFDESARTAIIGILNETEPELARAITGTQP